MKRWTYGLCLVLLLCPLLLVVCSSAADALKASSLNIVDARVENSEDAPAVAKDYAFLAGDFLYFRFSIAGFQIKGNEDSGPRRVALECSIEVEDERGTLLAPAQKLSVDEEVSAQDKDWVPTRRVSVLLPSYVAAGIFHVHVTVDDENAKTSVSRDYPFLMYGTKVALNGVLGIQNLRFLRNEADGPGLEVPSYRPGDAVWARFDMTGFTVGPQNVAELSYGLTVARPDGKVIFSQETAALQKLEGLFYPPQVVPGVLSVTTTTDLLPGQYTLNIVVRDIIGKKRAEITKNFAIE